MILNAISTTMNRRSRFHRFLMLALQFVLLLVVGRFCIYPMSLLAFDYALYPWWANWTTPNPIQLTLITPQLLQTALPDTTHTLWWYRDGSALLAIGTHWEVGNANPDDFLLVIDAESGAVLEERRVDDHFDWSGEFGSLVSFPTPTDELVWGTCPHLGLSVHGQQLEFNEWRVELWKDDSLIAQYTMLATQWFDQLHPPYPGRFSFSPTCDYFALTLSGWIYWEGEGRQELWIMNIPAGTFERELEGRWAAFRTWDYPVQELSFDWSPDGTQLVFGDPYFGSQILDVLSGKQWRLAEPAISGYQPEWAPTGQWIATQRQTGQGAAINIIAADASHYVSTAQCGFISDRQWSPSDNRFAYLCSESVGGPRDLLLWTMPSEP